MSGMSSTMKLGKNESWKEMAEIVSFCREICFSLRTSAVIFFIMKDCDSNRKGLKKSN